jgi:hypothetical protein
MLSVVALDVVMLNVFMLNVFMLNVFMLNVFMLNVFKLNVVILSAVAPFRSKLVGLTKLMCFRLTNRKDTSLLNLSIPANYEFVMFYCTGARRRSKCHTRLEVALNCVILGPVL